MSTLDSTFVQQQKHSKDNAKNNKNKNNKKWALRFLNFLNGTRFHPPAFIRIHSWLVCFMHIIGSSIGTVSPPILVSKAPSVPGASAVECWPLPMVCVAWNGLADFECGSLNLIQCHALQPVRIRLARFGRRHLPFYRIRVCDSRSPRDGKFIEQVEFLSCLYSGIIDVILEPYCLFCYSQARDVQSDPLAS